MTLKELLSKNKNNYTKIAKLKGTNVLKSKFPPEDNGGRAASGKFGTNAQRSQRSHKKGGPAIGIQP